MDLFHLAYVVVFYTALIFLVNIVGLKMFPLPEALRHHHPLVRLLSKTSEKKYGTFLTIGLIFVVLSASLLGLIVIVVSLGIDIFSIISVVMIAALLAFVYLHQKASSQPWSRTKILGAYASAFVISASWLIFPNWLTQAALALIPVFILVASTKPLGFRHLLLLLSAVFLYDITNVFGTEWMLVLASSPYVQNSVMMVKAPANILEISSHTISMLGAGDIAFSSLGIATAYSYGIFYYGLAAFAVGIGISYLLVLATGQGIPAMMPLSPSILVAILLGAKINDRRLD